MDLLCLPQHRYPYFPRHGGTSACSLVRGPFGVGRCHPSPPRVIPHECTRLYARTYTHARLFMAWNVSFACTRPSACYTCVYASSRCIAVSLSLSLFRVAARRVPDYSPFSFLLPRAAYLCDFSLSLIHVFERAITCVMRPSQCRILITTLFEKCRGAGFDEQLIQRICGAFFFIRFFFFPQNTCVRVYRLNARRKKGRDGRSSPLYYLLHYLPLSPQRDENAQNI